MAKKNYELIAVSTSSNQLLHFQPVRSTTPIWETVGGFANVGCFLKLKRILDVSYLLQWRQLHHHLPHL